MNNIFWGITIFILTILAFIVPCWIMIVLLIVPSIAALVYFPNYYFPYILIGPWIGLILINIIKIKLKDTITRLKK